MGQLVSADLNFHLPEHRFTCPHCPPPTLSLIISFLIPPPFNKKKEQRKKDKMDVFLQSLTCAIPTRVPTEPRVWSAGTLSHAYACPAMEGSAARLVRGPLQLMLLTDKKKQKQKQQQNQKQQQQQQQMTQLNKQQL